LGNKGCAVNGKLLPHRASDELSVFGYDEIIMGKTFLKETNMKSSKKNGFLIFSIQKNMKNQFFTSVFPHFPPPRETIPFRKYSWIFVDVSSMLYIIAHMLL
jgi:hypothetical protein